MVTYLIRRVLLLIPTLIGITAVVFFVMALSPGGFGGTMLNQTGAQTSGQEAQQIREYFERRYGLDQPLVVQYGRWLNQVSPIGFATSDQVKLSKKEAAQVREQLAKGPVGDSADRLKQALFIVERTAAYTGQSPSDVADQLNAALLHPGQAVQFIERLGATINDASLKELARQAKQDPDDAQQKLLQLISFDAGTANRILFTNPTFKMPNLGETLRGRSVLARIGETLPITLLLNVISVPIIYIIAIVAGVYAANKRGGFFDVTSGGVMLALWSIPVMWAGVMFIGYLSNDQYLHWFPTSGLHSLTASSMAFLPSWGKAGFERGWLLDFAWHLVLPITCLTYGSFALLAKLTRGAVLENLAEDYVRTARAKGVPSGQILFRHVLRNSLLPLITVAVSILPGMLGGSVVVERIFAIQGMGNLTVTAAFMKDPELIMATTLISGLLVLVSWLIRDVLYAIADPRVSYE